MSLFGAANLVVTVTLAVMIIAFVFQTEQSGWQGRQSEAALNAAATVGAFVQRAQDTLALVTFWGDDELTANPDHIAQLLQANAAFLEVVYLDQRGQILAQANRDRPILANLFTIPQSNWFLQAQAGRAYLSGVQLSSADVPYLVLAVPAGGRAVVAVRLDLAILWQTVANIHFGQAGRACIVNGRGEVIAHTDPAVVLAQTTLAGRPELAAITQAPGQRWVGDYVNIGGTAVVGASAPVAGTDWLILMELPQAEAFAGTRTAAVTLGGAVILLGAGLSYVAGRLLEDLIRRPLRRLQAGADRLGQGDLSYRVAVARADELGVVAEAFNRMADRLSARDDELAAQADALRTSEARYRAIVEDQTELICRWRPDGTLTFVNEAYCRYFGQPREALLGHSFLVLIPEEDRPAVADHTARLSAGSPVEVIEHRVILADGSRRWQQWTDRALLGPEGEIREFAGVGRDITERKAAEAQIQAVEQYYRELFEDAPMMYIVTRAEPAGPRLVDCNRRFCETLGYTPAEVVGRPLADFYTPESNTQLREHGYQAALAGHLLSQERGLVARDGRVIQTLLWALPALDKAGQAVGTRALFVDVSGRIKAEAALRESEYRYRLLADELQRLNSELEQRVRERTAELAQANAALTGSETRLRRITDNMLDMIVQIDMQGRCAYVSPSHQAALGYAPGDWEGRPLAELIHPAEAEAALAAILAAVRAGVSASRSMRLRHAAGYYLWLESVANPLRDAAGQVVGAIVASRNITQRKQAESRAAAFSELGYQMSSVATMTAAAEVIAASADALLGWDVFFLDLYLADRDLMQTVLFIDTLDDGQRQNITAESPTYAPTATTRRVMAAGPLLIQREQPDEPIPGMTYWGDSSRTPASLMFLPIRNGVQFVGWLSIQSYRDQAYDEAALQTAQALAAHCAGALERLRAEAGVRASLREKEVMLKEIHHRVKNNLQVISSLLNLQTRTVSEPQVLELLRDSQNRVRSMALVHEKLYRSPDLARIDLGEYTRSLAGQLLRSYADQAGRVTLAVEASDCWLDVDTAVPCGLILNELVSNALKHAFPEGRRGEITLRVQVEQPDRALLAVRDTGVGFPAEVDFRTSPSLGLQLVNSLVAQIDGAITLERGAGTTFKIVFPIPAAAGTGPL